LFVPTKLRVLALASLLFACAPAPPKSPGDSKLEVGEEPAPLGYVEIGRLEATHGKGCGVFGDRGNAEGAMQSLRNAALARGAHYLQVTKTTEPTADRNCVSHVYKAEGVAYRKPAPRTEAPVAPPAPSWQVLYSSSTEISVPDSRTRLTPPEQANILHTLFDRFIESGVCASRSDPSAPPNLEDARATGQFRPAIGDAVAGSFTAPGVKELLLLVHVGECHANAEQRYGTRRFVVMQGDTPVVNVETDVTHLESAKDLDLNGTLEVLAVAEGTRQGVLEKQAMLFSFVGGKLNALDILGPVFEDTCASAMPSGVKSTVVNVLPGTRPELRMDRKQSPCPRPPAASP
jgi:hypothetical protein